jgi:hypothetical protein
MMRRGSSPRSVTRSRVGRFAGHVVGIAFASLVVALAACGTSNSPTCYAGDLLSCVCLGGSSGTQACTSNGSYGPCTCQAVDSGSPRDSSSGNPGEAGNPGDVGTDLPYMATCAVVGNPGDCASPDQCFDFPNRGMYCTHTCSANTDCAPPSTGCNGMGVCKAPNATPPDGG